MGSVSINCSISLSKKLRSILSDSENSSVVLIANVQNGKGLGKLSLTAEGMNEVMSDIAELGETSIQLTPIDYVDEIPTSDSKPQATIFSTIPPKGQSESVIDKLAAVHPPEEGEESYAVVAKKDIETPKAFAHTQEPEYKEWIANMEELIDAVRDAKGKKSDIDPDMAQNDRERALLLELKEKDEAIDRPAWIVNQGGGVLIINDLDITLPLDTPYDLSNLSARRIIMSRDLKALIKGGFVRFLSPSEKDQYALGDEDIASRGLSTFDSPDEAEASMKNSVAHNPVIDEDSAMDLTEKDLNGPTTEENMIINLTQAMPLVKDETKIISNEPVRHTVHGATQSNANSTQDAKESNAIPIRKLT